jgi:hypothetical protein
MRRRSLPLLVTLIILALLVTASARNFVSYRGGFYIELPEGWDQVDYKSVDLFLSRNQAGATTYDYEGVFSPTSNRPFFNGDYLTLTFDSTSKMDQKTVDSILTDLKSMFGVGIRYEPLGNLGTKLHSREPVYDKEQNLIYVNNDVEQADKSIKKNLLIMKLFDKGVASFYFYAPDSTFEESRYTFLNIVNSFSTENFDSVIPKESVSVANVDDREIPEPEEDSDAGSSRRTIAITAVLGAAVIVIIVAARKKKVKVA